MSLVFYDFETTGISPAFDQPLQFAAIRATDDLIEEDAINIRCRLSPHILPAPGALAVTDIDPNTLTDPALPSWFEFTRTLSDLIDRWGPATWIGYNSIRFDEEVLRQSLFQNLHPNPYLTQIDGNDRMDIMKIVHAVWAMARDALTWPVNDDDDPVFRLDRLAPENGFDHHDAHDALGDVRATLHIARLIKDGTPMIWEKSLRTRSKREVNALLESGRPLRLVERFGGQNPRTFVGAYCGRNPNYANAVGFLDLERVDPRELAEADDADLAAALEASPQRIRTVTVNQCPSLFVLEDPPAEIEARAAALADMTDLHRRAGEALAGRYADGEEPEHVEWQIHSGFYGAADKRLLTEFQESPWEHRATLPGMFEDPRLRQLGQRTVFLNRPDLLAGATRERLSQSVRERWMSNDPDAPWTTFAKVESGLEEIEARGTLEAGRLQALKEFYAGLEAI